jgi:hypothetical protein
MTIRVLHFLNGYDEQAIKLLVERKEGNGGKEEQKKRGDGEKEDRGKIVFKFFFFFNKEKI